MTTISTPISATVLKKRLLSGGTWALIGKMSVTITGIVVNGLLARLLAPEEMGSYFLTLSLVTIAALLGRMGLADAVVRLVAEAMGKQDTGRAYAAIRSVFLYGSVGCLIVVTALLTGPGKWIAENLFEDARISQVLGLAAIWVIGFVFQALLGETFRGFHDIRFATLFGNAIRGIISLILFGALWLGQGHSNLEQVLMLSVAAIITNDLIGFFFLRNKVRNLERTTQIPPAQVINIAWPLLLNGITVFALVRANLWVLGSARPSEEIALYGAALQLVTLVTTPLLLVNAVVPPLIAEMYFQGKRKKLESTLRTVTSIAALPTGIALVGFIFAGKYILGLVFGEFYQQGAVILALLSVGQSANVWTGPCGALLKMSDHQKTLMMINLTYGALSIVVSIFLVNLYGAWAIALVSAVALILQNITILVIAKRKTNVWTHIYLNPVFLQKLLMNNVKSLTKHS